MKPTFTPQQLARMARFSRDPIIRELAAGILRLRAQVAEKEGKN